MSVTTRARASAPDEPAGSTPTVEPDSEPTVHRGEPWFARLGRFSVRRRRTVIVLWIVAALAAAPLALTLTGALSGAGWEAQGSTALKVRDELRQDFPGVPAEAAIVVVRQDVPIAEDSSGLAGVVAALADAPGAAAVADPLQMPPDAGLISPDGVTAMIPVDLEAEVDADRPESAGELIDYVGDLDLPPGTIAEVTGEW
ncbi:MAG: hypothetical protein KDB21_11735, partial [Acidimicrobiales bacterium]|nr:hypothetical protein [Acidimicrobiales bacterium]